MKAKSPNKWLWGCGIAAVLGMLLIVSGYITFLTNCTILRISAFYGGVQFQGHGDSYSEFSTDSPEQCQLYLDIPRHGPVLLRELKEEMLSELAFDRMETSNPSSGTFYGGRSGLGGTIKFKNGVLTAMRLTGGVKLQFSDSPDGPWLQLPVTPQRLNEVFGPPDHKSRRRVERPIRWS